VEVARKCTIALESSNEGWRTTVPELSWLYGRGLDSKTGGGGAVGWATAVWAQFDGILFAVIR